MHSRNCFLTLTYSDEHLPSDYSIDLRTLQLFLKKLREFADTRIRFFGAGEYGDKEQRPHYHALIFNYDFNDKILYTIKNKNKIYTSPSLSKIWPYGFSTIGSANYQTAAYCARYTLKKIGGDLAAEHYTRVHPLTGKLVTVQPEFSTQSRGRKEERGLGYSWFQKYKSDVFPSDFVIVDGKKHPVPKYYLKLLEEDERKRIKRRRDVSTKGEKPATKERRWNTTRARLKVREEVFAARIKRLERTLK